MLATKKKIVLLCLCLMVLISIISCKSASPETYIPVDTDVIAADEHEETTHEELPLEEPHQEEVDTLQLLLDTANTRRLGIGQVEEQTVRELAYSRDFTFYDLTPLMPGEWQSLPPTVTPEEAIEDVEIFFDVLRYVYGAYQYFGGDEVFEPVKEQIIKDILRDSNAIAGTEFVQLLYRHLSPIIIDHHLSIRHGSSAFASFGPSYSFLVSSDAFFDKSDFSFRNRENGLYITEIIGYDLVDIMRLQLDESVRHFYAPVVMRDGLSAASLMLTIVYEDGTNGELELRVPSSHRNSIAPPTVLTYIDDIPVVPLKMMLGLGDTAQGQYSKKFLDYARLLQDEPVVILDLRTNEGGSPILPIIWMHLLSGEVVRENAILLTNWGSGFEYPWRPWGDTPETNKYYIPVEYGEEFSFLFHRTIVNGFPIENFNGRRIVEREQILIVLVDRSTASAGELFTDIAFNMKNTLVIGQNTFGTLTCNLSYPYLRMPNSGIILGLGRGLMLHPEGHFAEGVGYRPDVWVTGDALAAAIAMLTN